MSKVLGNPKLMLYPAIIGTVLGFSIPLLFTLGIIISIVSVESQIINYLLIAIGWVIAHVINFKLLKKRRILIKL